MYHYGVKDCEQGIVWPSSHFLFTGYYSTHLMHTVLAQLCMNRVTLKKGVDFTPKPIHPKAGLPGGGGVQNT